MYLKQVELQGFKSFAEKTVFEFHKGITCIVGPNGSGKSNISDAVRWVLGEQSARQMRGHNMQDVIFAGTQNRRAVSYASVSLLLDNADGALPIEYQQVQVTRRIYRSGESEYLLNGTACRLRDIQELFYDTGVGKEGYSLIGQGQIEKILSGKPKDRRELFDEAAGIVKFKRRKNAALKKLEAQQDNLIRVNDILSELERQIGPLKRQSEKAKIYLQKRDALKDVDVKLFVMRSSVYETQKTTFEENIAQLQDELQAKREKYETGREETDRIEQAQRDQEETIERLRTAVSESTLRKSALENQIELLAAQGRSDELSRAHYAGRLSDLEDKIAEKEALRGENTQKSEAIHQSLSEALLQQEETRGALETYRQSIDAAQKRVDEINARILSLMEEKTDAEGLHRHYDTLLQETARRREEFEVQEREASSLRREKTRKAQESDASYRAAQEKIRDLQEALEKVQSSLTALTEERNTLRDRQEETRRVLAQASSRLETIRNMAERYEGYGQSIRKVMQKHHPGVIGVVADLIQVEKRYETAIETALGGSIQNIVTTDADAAREMIEYLKKERLGRATFLPLTDVTGRRPGTEERALQEPGVIGMADTLVQYDARFRGIVSSLLGGILVVDAADHAIAAARKYRHTLRIVTLEGEYLRPGGSMTGGAFRSNANLLGRRREQEALSQTIGKLQGRQNETASRLDDITAKRSDLRDEIARLQDALSREEIAANTALMDLKRLSDEEKSLEAQIEKARAEIEETDAQLKASEEQHAGSAGQIRCIEEERGALEDENTKLGERLHEERAAHKRLSEEAQQQTLSIQSLHQNAEFLEAEQQRLLEETEQLKEEADGIRKTQADALRRADAFQDRTREIESQIEEAKRQADEADAQLKEAQQEKEKLNASYRRFFEKREETTQEIARLEKEEMRLTDGLSRLEESMESAVSYLWEEYGLTQREAAAAGAAAPESETALKKRKKELTDEIRGIGNVNVNAIEEYKEVGARYETMTAQRSDIEEAARNLDKMIANLDTGMRKQFREQFARIQEEFQKVFSELFGGGHGMLELVEGEDDLDTGIDIIAQPPGKKLQNMMQLSGGEKALTAISLLFAIQNLKPSPFCILDEIEAALDEPNVERFAQYLCRLSTQTQFIVITHRRGTMAAADRLYGVTMQERGVSVQVSVELVEEEMTQEEARKA